METEKREILKLALEKCNLYLDKRIISRSIYRKYVEFIIDTIFSNSKTAYISVIPDDRLLSVTFLVAGLLTYINNQLSVDEYIEMLKEASGDEAFKFTFDGLVYQFKDKKDDMVVLYHSQQNLKVSEPRERWNEILDYAGNAKDRVKHNDRVQARIKFFESLFGEPSKMKALAVDNISFIGLDKKERMICSAPKLLDQKTNDWEVGF